MVLVSLLLLLVGKLILYTHSDCGRTKRRKIRKMTQNNAKRKIWAKKRKIRTKKRKMTKILTG